jgi:excinuclease ABC subunit C
VISQSHKKIVEKLSHLPTKPGVYLFKDKRGKIIYVGKAKRLRNRVRSYFQKSRVADPKLDRLVSRIDDLETIVTDSEVEALILEAIMVKENKPRYNVNLKDDKSFPYIRVTNEPYPRIFPTRKLIQDGSKYFGPYTDVLEMKLLLKTVKKIFTIRSCNYNLTPDSIARKKFKICLDYHIKRCNGPCENLISMQEYKEMIGHVVDFIEGRVGKVVQEIQMRMDQATRKLHFEEAARLRDRLKQIEMFRQRQKVVDPALVDRDIVALAKDGNDSCCVVFKMREGKIIGRQHFFLNGSIDAENAAVMAAFLKQFYLKTADIPPEVFLSDDVGDDVDALQDWLSQKRKSLAKIVVPQEGDSLKLIKMCQQNASLLLEELKLQRLKSEEYTVKSVQALQEDLGLERPPKRIEGFDISNIQGAEPVASMVAFMNGQPQKSEYRKFKIRSKSTPDDFTMMREVVERRYTRLLKENKPFPDLVLIDGGKGQLNAALQSLKKLGIDTLPVIALAKRLDEVFVPASSEPQNIKKGSPGLYLLQRVRDESHRFALTFHRSLRTKRNLASVLEQIPGVGESRRKRLLATFKTVKNITSASIDDLAKIEGISQKLAQQIWEFFNPGSA